MLSWNDNFSVGVKAFDEHHHRLFDLLNGLLTAVENGTADEGKLVAALKELIDYTDYHFKAEEDLLRKNGYQGFQSRSLNIVTFPRP